MDQDEDVCRGHRDEYDDRQTGKARLQRLVLGTRGGAEQSLPQRLPQTHSSALCKLLS